MDFLNVLILAGAIVVVALLSGGAVFLVMRRLDALQIQDAQANAQTIVARAEDEAAETKRRAALEAENFKREAELELKEKSMKQKEEFDAEKRKSYQELVDKERQLDKRRATLDQMSEELQTRQTALENDRRVLAEKIGEHDALSEDLKKKIAEQERALYDMLNLSKEEATKLLMSKLDRELTEEEGALILKHEKKVAERCEEKAKEIFLQSLQRYAAAHTAESTTSAVDIPNDDMKGRVIGREGRNIRAFEKVTGVDLIIDDTPGVIIVSAFEPIRRETARLTLTRLIADGRIHPARIEEIYKQTQNDVQEFMQRAGVEACQEVDVHGLNERVVNLLGRLYFRTSYSQNVLRHSVEVAFLSGMIAVELGLDERLARRCGLLHDVGKAADHEVEGGHPKIGADILKRCGEPREVVLAAQHHHDDPRIASPYTTIVAAADACSASRPGARRETLENYIKRMEELEKIARDFPYVEQAFAVQAGREMRVLVNSQLTTDEGAAKICRDIACELKKRLQFPGEIKVTVIRETRATEIVSK